MSFRGRGGGGGRGRGGGGFGGRGGRGTIEIVHTYKFTYFRVHYFTLADAVFMTTFMAARCF